MSDTKFTKGPWVFRVWAQNDEAIARMKEVGMEPLRLLMNDGAAPITSTDTESGSPRICLVDCKTPYKRGQGYLQECAERDANAHLIAAAPELYAALSLLVRNIEQPLDIATSQYGIVEAKTALAKARGES